jgi:hypothetical protein
MIRNSNLVMFKDDIVNLRTQCVTFFFQFSDGFLNYCAFEIALQV